MDDVEATLKSIYFDPKNIGSFGEVNKLWREARKIHPEISKLKVQEWLASQDSYTLFKQIRRNFLRIPITVNHVDEQWQADLLDMSWFARYNDHVKYLLVTIDLFSRFAWIRPLKDKSATSIIQAFDLILSEGRKPLKLQTDQGKEFVNSMFKQYCKDKEIEFFTTTDDTIKCAIVERFNRTIRTRIYRLLHHKNSHRYIDDLKDLVTSYNNSFHRSIGRSPSSVNPLNKEKVAAFAKKTRKIKTSKAKFTVGDIVRISRKKGTFEKGTTSNWSQELFKIIKRLKTPQGYI